MTTINDTVNTNDLARLVYFAEIATPPGYETTDIERIFGIRIDGIEDVIDDEDGEFRRMFCGVRVPMRWVDHISEHDFWEQTIDDITINIELP